MLPANRKKKCVTKHMLTERTWHNNWEMASARPHQASLGWAQLNFITLSSVNFCLLSNLVKEYAIQYNRWWLCCHGDFDGDFVYTALFQQSNTKGPGNLWGIIYNLYGHETMSTWYTCMVIKGTAMPTMAPLLEAHTPVRERNNW